MEVGYPRTREISVDFDASVVGKLKDIINSDASLRVWGGGGRSRSATVVPTLATSTKTSRRPNSLGNPAWVGQTPPTASVKSVPSMASCSAPTGVSVTSIGLSGTPQAFQHEEPAPVLAGTMCIAVIPSALKSVESRPCAIPSLRRTGSGEEAARVLAGGKVYEPTSCRGWCQDGKLDVL